MRPHKKGLLNGPHLLVSLQFVDGEYKAQYIQKSNFSCEICADSNLVLLRILYVKQKETNSFDNPPIGTKATGDLLK
jgi:hypothetical protein